MKYCPVCKAKYDDSLSFCPTDGEVLEDDPTSIVNTVLDGQYQIEALLGKGGMGAVYRARHILLGDRVAIKILPPEMRNNAEWLRRFRREGQAARRFRHPNAVTVYDLRTASDGTIYLVMEYVEGHTLDAELKSRGRFAPAEAFACLEPIMSVLNEAHAMGVVHRDLKPENIMIGKATTGGEATMKLLDLGVAKLREVAGSDTSAATALTTAGQMLGTPYYMSPEQWGELPRDGSSEIDGRADIYSLGFVFYEMITGQKPYSAKTLLELRREHVTAIPRNLHDVVPEVPQAFSEAIARAMSKDRGDRPATVAEFAAELKASLGANGHEEGAASGDFSKASTTQSGTSTAPGGKASRTLSDVNAATIVTMDELPTGAKGRFPQAASAAPGVAAPLNVSAETIAESASNVAVPLAPRVTEEPALARPQLALPVKSRRSSVGLIVGGIIVFILIVAGVGGVLLVNSMRGKTPDGNRAGNSSPNNNNTAPPAAAKEVARYWLEVSAKTKDAKPAQIVPMAPIASGQLIRFHFTPSENGYLYIIGPGEKNEPTAFLTAKPSRATGVSSNEVRKGVDFIFPDGKDQWLELDKNPGTESYRFIFSTTPLSSPQFLNEETKGHPLSQSEQTELSSFLEQHKANAGKTDYDNSNAAAPFVTVKAPAKIGSDNPLILEIRIEHK
jgi:serine/threonine protein kinase